MEGEQQNRQLRNLTSLLIRKPDLAGLVRHFTLHTVNPEYGHSSDSESSGDSESSEDSECSEYSKELEEAEEDEEPEELEESGESEGLASPKRGRVDQTLKTAVSAWNLSEEEENDWLRQLSRTRKSRHNAVLALLLPALLKLEKVVLELRIGQDTHYLGWMINRAARKERPFDIQQPFEALAVFACPHNQFNKKKHTIDFLASLLKLPAIREISGGFKSKRNDFLAHVRYCKKNPIKIDRSSSSVTSLDLAAYAISPKDFGQVVRAPKTLKTLSYTVCLPANFKTADIHHILRSQETHLESFSLDYDPNYEDFYAIGTVPNLQELDYFGPIKSFLSFTSLRVFKIAVLFLLTTENGTNAHKLINFFPPSLERLHLTRFQGRFEGLLEAVEHLLASKTSQHICSLKTLILDESTVYAAREVKLMNVMWKGTQQTAMERLSSLAAAQGVSFDVIEGFVDEESFVEDEELDGSVDS